MPRAMHTALVLLGTFLKARDPTINIFRHHFSTAKPQGLLSSSAANDSVTSEHTIESSRRSPLYGAIESHSVMPAGDINIVGNYSSVDHS